MKIYMVTNVEGAVSAIFTEESKAQRWCELQKIADEYLSVSTMDTDEFSDINERKYLYIYAGISGDTVELYIIEPYAYFCTPTIVTKDVCEGYTVECTMKIPEYKTTEELKELVKEYVRNEFKKYKGENL